MSDESKNIPSGNRVREAFLNAQRGFAPALKTSVNPHFRSSYVSLDGAVEAVIDSLHANDLALIQKTHPSEKGVAVETIFIHASGEELSGGVFELPAIKLSPQDFGSALTYARRYSLMAACGIAPEDDDGELAQDGYRDSKPHKPAAKPLPEGSCQHAPKVEVPTMANPGANAGPGAMICDGKPPTLTTWKAIKLHVGKNSKGKLLGDLPETVIQNFYDLYANKECVSKDDKMLKTALLMWNAERNPVTGNKALLAKLEASKIDPVLFGSAVKEAGILSKSLPLDYTDGDADYALSVWDDCLVAVDEALKEGK